jgi:hypothetical protein
LAAENTMRTLPKREERKKEGQKDEMDDPAVPRSWCYDHVESDWIKHSRRKATPSSRCEKLEESQISLLWVEYCERKKKDCLHPC